MTYGNESAIDVNHGMPPNLAAARRRLRVTVASPAGTASSLVFTLEVLGHQVIAAATGEKVLELTGADVYVIEDSLPDMGAQALAELMRLDRTRDAAWIFAIAPYARAHRAVSHDTGVFDRVVVAPVTEATLRELLEQAARPRHAAAN